MLFSLNFPQTTIFECAVFFLWDPERCTGSPGLGDLQGNQPHCLCLQTHWIWSQHTGLTPILLCDLG